MLCIIVWLKETRPKANKKLQKYEDGLLGRTEIVLRFSFLSPYVNKKVLCYLILIWCPESFKKKDCRFYCTVCLTFRACEAVFLLCPHAKHTDRICLKKDIYRSFSSLFTWKTVWTYVTGQGRSKVSTCKPAAQKGSRGCTRRPNFFHLCWRGWWLEKVGALHGTSECSRHRSICAALLCPRRCSRGSPAALTDSAMCCHQRSAPKLRGVQAARAQAEKPVHVQRVCEQMLYVHMLNEHGGPLQDPESHVTLLTAIPSCVLNAERFTS